MRRRARQSGHEAGRRVKSRQEECWKLTPNPFSYVSKTKNHGPTTQTDQRAGTQGGVHTYTLTPGSRKRYTEDCRTKYANTNNFGGFNELPGPDKVLGLGGTEGSNL